MTPRHDNRIGRTAAMIPPLLAAIALLGAPLGHPAQGADIPGGKYIGAGKCRNCHKKEGAGNQWGKWKKMRHSKAWETLGSEKALEVARKKGIDDPRKSPECLKCHVTAYEEPASIKAKSFDPKLGVQCESCHGAGQQHMKARLAAAAEEDEEEDGFGDEEEAAGEEEVGEYQELPAGELVKVPSAATCRGCHNEKSPTFEKFDCEEQMDKILHLDPRRKRDRKRVIAELCREGQ